MSTKPTATRVRALYEFIKTIDRRTACKPCVVCSALHRGGTKRGCCNRHQGKRGAS